MHINTYGGTKEDGVRPLSVGLSNRLTGSDQKSKYRKICLNRKKTFYDVGGQTLAQAVQRVWGVSNLGGIESLTEHTLEQPALADPALTSVLDDVISRGALQPQQFCDQW